MTIFVIYVLLLYKRKAILPFAFDGSKFPDRITINHAKNILYGAIISIMLLQDKGVSHFLPSLNVVGMIMKFY